MKQPAYFIGLMSGTSADAVDVVAVEFVEKKLILHGSHSVSLSPQLRQKIHDLATPNSKQSDEIDRLGALDQELGELFAAATNDLIHQNNLLPTDIVAIGSHGQTIRHRPPSTTQYPFSLQIGDPNVIAQRTGITTVADFRRRDMAAGGQGAPLVPAFHQALFQHLSIDRIIINIGGMANITWLPAKGNAAGFDTGPGNVLMDGWILKNLMQAYDANGGWAASGQVHQELLQQLLQHPFFTQLPPKSTGREAFNLDWLENELTKLNSAVNAADVQATLLALTAISIKNSITTLTQNHTEIFVCGGGAYNLFLINEMQRQLPNSKVTTTASLGIAPEWVEAMAFAWLAKQTMSRLNGNLCAVTGATEEVILGGVYFS